jgi:hypothetical protein
MLCDDGDSFSDVTDVSHSMSVPAAQLPALISMWAQVAANNASLKSGSGVESIGLDTDATTSVSVPMPPKVIRTVSSDHGPVSVETLDASCDEYVGVASELCEAVPSATVKMIEKITNQSIEERYEMSRKIMVRRNQKVGSRVYCRSTSLGTPPHATHYT